MKATVRTYSRPPYSRLERMDIDVKLIQISGQAADADAGIPISLQGRGLMADVGLLPVHTL